MTIRPSGFIEGISVSVKCMAPKKFTAFVFRTALVLNPFSETPALLTRMSMTIDRPRM